MAIRSGRLVRSRAPHWKCGKRGNSFRGFESLPLRHCHVSGHRRHLSHEIGDILSTYALVVLGRVQDEFAQYFAILGNHGDVAASDQELHAPVFEGPANANVVQLAVVAKRDPAVSINFVVSNPKVSLFPGCFWCGLNTGCECTSRSAFT